jgi:hypothetical protein
LFAVDVFDKTLAAAERACEIVTLAPFEAG